jgi:hypothetical protein
MFWLRGYMLRMAIHELYPQHLSIKLFNGVVKRETKRIACHANTWIGVVERKNGLLQYFSLVEWNAAKYC